MVLGRISSPSLTLHNCRSYDKLKKKYEDASPRCSEHLQDALQQAMRYFNFKEPFQLYFDCRNSLVG